MDKKSTTNFNVIDEEQESYKRSISFLLELLVKIIIWGTVAVFFIKNLSFNHILYDSSLGGLFLAWIFSIIYPNRVIKFCFSEQDKVSRVYSTLFILVFSLGTTIDIISSTKNYSFLFDLNLFVLYLNLSSLILIYIYPKGTIFYIWISQDSLSSLKINNPLQMRVLTSCNLIQVTFVYLVSLFTFLILLWFSS